jgi:hypothetical protein
MEDAKSTTIRNGADSELQELGGEFISNDMKLARAF